MKIPEKNVIKKGDVLKIYTDGASRGNPGPSAWAFIFVKGEEIIYSESEYLGKATNNVAEYTAVIKALEKAVEYTRWNVEIYSDSELIINQLNRKWRIKKDHLKDLHKKVVSEKANFNEVNFVYIPREFKFIKEADRFCNDCLNKHVGGTRDETNRTFTP